MKKKLMKNEQSNLAEKELEELTKQENNYKGVSKKLFNEKVNPIKESISKKYELLNKLIEELHEESSNSIQLFLSEKIKETRIEIAEKEEDLKRVSQKYAVPVSLRMLAIDLERADNYNKGLELGNELYLSLFDMLKNVNQIKNCFPSASMPFPIVELVKSLERSLLLYKDNSRLLKPIDKLKLEERFNKEMLELIYTNNRNKELQETIENM